MAKNLKAISSDNDLAYYTNELNIPNQTLVNDTIEYFKTGEGARAFKPLPFLNLLDKQFNFLKENIKDCQTLISHLTSLPLSELEKHILFGFIIKWTGGYPVNNLNDDYDFSLKAIQKEFLTYKGETPEKEFCKADYKQRNKFMKFGIAYTTAYNNGLDFVEVYNAMEQLPTNNKSYLSFDELFEAEANNKTFGEFKDKNNYFIERSRYNFEFNIWLQETKGIDYNDEIQYREFLTIEYLSEFLKFEKAKRLENKFWAEIGKIELDKNSRFNELREMFRVKRRATKKDCELIPGLKEGDVLESDPTFKTSTEAYELLTNYYGKLYLEVEKSLFIEKYKVFNAETIKGELIELEKFITYSETHSLADACQAFGKFEGDTNEYVYLRLKSGFYENLEVQKYPLINAYGNEEARIYGKYFLFYELLKQLEKPLEQIYYNFQFNIFNTNARDFIAQRSFHSLVKTLNDNAFQSELKKLNPEEFHKFLDYHLRFFIRKGGGKSDYVNHTKAILPVTLTPEQKDSFLTWIEANELEAETLPQQHDKMLTSQETISELRDKINIELTPLQHIFNTDKDFHKAIDAIEDFYSGTTYSGKKIFVKSGNIKYLAYALGEIWRSQKNDVISYEYLQFYKSTFTNFESQNIDPKNIMGCNLYKYSISKA